jgi:hypothetical protein
MIVTLSSVLGSYPDASRQKTGESRMVEDGSTERPRWRPEGGQRTT